MSYGNTGTSVMRREPYIRVTVKPSALPSFQMQFCPGPPFHTVCPKVGLGQPELTLANSFLEQYLSLRSGGLRRSVLWPPEKAPYFKVSMWLRAPPLGLSVLECMAHSVSTNLTHKIYFLLIMKEITRTWPSEYCEEPQFPEP